MNSAWPTKHEFQRPLIISNLQVWPLETNVPSAPQPQKTTTGPIPPRDIRLQMQLYGNKQGTYNNMQACTVVRENFMFSNK